MFIQCLQSRVCVHAHVISNDLEDCDWHAQVCLIRFRAKLCRNGPDLRIPDIASDCRLKL